MHSVKPTSKRREDRSFYADLGVRNKSNRVGLVCAASSSSCMVAFKPFNNNKHISLADIVPGIVMNTGTQ